MTAFDRILKLGMVLTVAVGCRSSGREHTAGDRAFTAGESSRAIAEYRQQVETTGRLRPEQRFRFALALASVQSEENLTEARAVAGALVASGDDDGSAQALVAILEHLQQEEARSAVLADRQSRLVAELARARDAEERQADPHDSTLRAELISLERRLDEVEGELARSRQRLVAESERCRGLQQQIDELKRIDLGDHE